jgi:hypothetical protein
MDCKMEQHQVSTATESLALWNAIGPVDRTTFKDLYHDWKRRFDHDGWSAFDEAEKALFDELKAEFGDTLRRRGQQPTC